MNSNRSAGQGCKTCLHQYFEHGETKCRLRPHDYATREQREIVAWLRVHGRDAWTDAGCPSHVEVTP